MKVKLLTLFFLSLYLNTISQYKIPDPTKDDIYKVARDVLSDNLKEAGLTQADLKLGYFGGLNRFCDKLYFACEGDVYTAIVSAETNKNKEGVSYIGELKLTFSRNDFGSCKLTNNWALWTKNISRWDPIGKKSKVTGEKTAFTLLQKGIEEKKALHKFKQHITGYTIDLISIDNIIFNPKDDPTCDFRKSDLKDLKSKVYSDYEVLAFYAELTFAYFEKDDDSKYTDIVKIWKEPAFINLFIDNNMNVTDVSVNNMNCWEKEIFKGNQSGKYVYDTLFAWASEYPLEMVYNKKTSIPFKYSSLNYKGKFLDATLNALKQVGKDRAANQELLKDLVSQEAMDEWLNTIDLIFKSKNQIEIKNYSNAGFNMPIYTIEAVNKKGSIKIGELNVWRESEFSHKEGKWICKLKNN